jgi:hypothetical protein
MKPDELNAYRAERLAAAVDKVSGGNKSEFGRKLGYADGAFVRQMLAGTRPITEKTVMQIEGLHGMAGWFSEDRAEEDGEAEQSFDLMPPDQLYDLILSRLQDVEKLADLLLHRAQKTEPAVSTGGENAATGEEWNSSEATPKGIQAQAHGRHSSVPAKKTGTHRK